MKCILPEYSDEAMTMLWSTGNGTVRGRIFFMDPLLPEGNAVTRQTFLPAGRGPRDSAMYCSICHACMSYEYQVPGTVLGRLFEYALRVTGTFWLYRRWSTIFMRPLNKGVCKCVSVCSILMSDC